VEIESNISVVTLDWKHLLENRLQPILNAFGLVRFYLEKFDVRFLLYIDQVWEVDDFLDLAEINPIPSVRCHVA